MQAKESLPAKAPNTSPLAECLTNPAIMRDAERLLAGRTRDIKLTGAIRQAFLDRSWRQTAKIIRSWMVWVVILDALTLSMNMFLLPRPAAVSMLAPGAIIPLVALAIFLIWRERHPYRFLGSSLNAGMFLILLSVCLMGAAAGGQWQERYLYVMVFVGIAGITTFSIPMGYTWGIAGSCVGLYLLFQLQNPVVPPLEALATFLFFACGVAAVVVARRTMTVLAAKAFLLELRDGARLSALIEANKRLDRLSKIDPLTGVANRRWMSELFAELAAQPAEQRGSTAILMCDIDHFKALNDRLGHAKGDSCLAKIAAVIDNTVRSGSDHVARYGGEEFIVILPDTPVADALLIAERIRNAVIQAELPNPGSPSLKFVTVSIGIAARGQEQDWTPDELQWEADSALYLAKEAGRNSVRIFTSKDGPMRDWAKGAA